MERRLVIIGRILAALLLLISVNGCTVVPPKNNDVNAEIDQALQASVAANGKVDAQNKILPANLSDALMPKVVLGAPQATAKEALEPHFDVAVHNVSAQTFFLGLVKGTPYNITVSPAIKGTITLDLKNVTINQVLEAVQDLYGYEYSKADYGFKILPRQLQTKIFTVNYLNISRSGRSNTTISSGQITRTLQNSNGNSSSSTLREDVTPSSSVETDTKVDFWQALKDSLLLILGDKDGRLVVVNPQSGLVIIKAYPNELNKVGQYLDSIQNIAARQVIIEAKILEVTLSAEYQAGIDWRILGLQQTGNKTINDNLNFGDAFGNIFKLDASDGTSFSTVIKMLNNQGRVAVLSSPRIAALNNEKAVIKVGEDEFFVTNVASNTAISGSNATEISQDINLTPFFSGIALDVTPQINEAGDVILHIHPIVSTVTEQTKTMVIGDKIQTIPLAKSAIRESDDIVRAKNGQVIIIGGLMENSNASYEASSPGADKLPAISGLFKDTNRGSKKMELVILLKPTVIGDGTWRDRLQEMAKNFRETPKEFKYEIKRKRNN